MSVVNLKELADLPGAGTARKVLEANGLFDLYGGDGPEWCVTLDGSRAYVAHFKVRACDADEARRKAMVIADRENLDWRSDGEVEAHSASVWEADA